MHMGRLTAFGAELAIDRRTGMASNGQGGDVIMEAFKPGTGPAQDFFVIGNLDSYQSSEEIIQSSPQANRAVTSGAGGLY